MNLKLNFDLKSILALYINMYPREFKPFINHSIMSAKISYTVMKKINPHENFVDIFLISMLHDVGFLIREAITNYSDFYSDLSERWDMDMLMKKFDATNEHAGISSAVMKYLGVEDELKLKAIEMHHEYEMGCISGGGIFGDVLRLSDFIAGNYSRHYSPENSDEFMEYLISEIRKEESYHPLVKECIEDSICNLSDYNFMFSEKINFPDIPEIEQKVLDINLAQKYIKLISFILDIRSPFTRNHSSQVAAISSKICEELLGTCDSQIAYISGLLHDIGKIKVPLKILHKKGKLNKYEFFIMQKHVVDTYVLLNKNGFSVIDKICGAHHERLDGSGYPHNLKGDEMLFIAKSIQVADVFSALIEDRPYREKMSYSKAISIIEEDVKRKKLDAISFEKLKMLIKNGYEFNGYKNIMKTFFGEKLI